MKTHAGEDQTKSAGRNCTMLRPVKATVYLTKNSLLYKLTVPQLVKKLFEFFF